MNIRETLRVAASAVMANKLRSILTMLGIIIGIAAVIAMVAMGEGAQRSIQERMQGLGTNVVTVRPGQGFQGGVARGDARLTVDDAEALDAFESSSIVAVAPEMSSRYQVDEGANNAQLSITGTWPNFFSIRNLAPVSGRVFTMAENDGRRRVAVLGASVGSNLGRTNTESLIGETIRIRGVSFEVIGVLEEKGEGLGSPDQAIYIPLSTAQYRVMGTDRINSISVQAASSDEITFAMADTDRALRRAHRLEAGQASDFTVQNQASLLTMVQDTARTFSFLLAGIAFISLVVGGIGIMNIMLVSVTERTKEIGLRKALGAKRRDLLTQFLIESLVLCLAGGALGLLAGVGGSLLLQKLGSFTTAISAESVLLAFGFSAAVGIFFGLWPARRAAGLPPIEALRFE